MTGYRALDRALGCGRAVVMRTLDLDLGDPPTVMYG